MFEFTEYRRMTKLLFDKNKGFHMNTVNSYFVLCYFKRQFRFCTNKIAGCI